MKTTLEIADDLFTKAQEVARREKTTFRALAEYGLRLALREKEKPRKVLPPLLTVKGKGLSREFRGASWERIRDAAYAGESSR